MRKVTLVFTVLCLLILGKYCCIAAEGISQAAAQARAGHMVKVIKDWSGARTRAVVLDQEGFGKGITIENWNAQRYTLAIYLHLEDGSTTFRPLRTGKEVTLYNKVKDFIAKRKSGEQLGPDVLLRMGLDACADGNGIANLQITFLTIHNVMRIMARPQTWIADFPKNRSDRIGHPETDPMYPVFKDLLGITSSGGTSLPDILKLKRQKSGEVPMFELISLFDQNKGVFQTQPGAINAEWNGGCTYYFWIGALAQTTLGSAVVMGALRGESKGKEGESAQQGAVELTHFVSGAIFGSEVIKAYR